MVRAYVGIKHPRLDANRVFTLAPPPAWSVDNPFTIANQYGASMRQCARDTFAR
jgi:hypothetical protein